MDQQTYALAETLWNYHLQIAQEIPPEVWRAFEALVRAGYDKYLI